MVRFLSEQPQIAVVDTGKNGTEQLAAIENKSLETWKLGGSYRIFADASGLYDAMPLLVGRYTYIVE